MLASMTDAPPTLNDLACVLKVSSASVWRALSGSPRVSNKTRGCIQYAVQRMMYRPSLAAQTLRHVAFPPAPAQFATQEP